MYGHQGRTARWDEPGHWNWHRNVMNTLHKLGSQGEPPVQHEEPGSELFGDLSGSGA